MIVCSLLFCTKLSLLLTVLLDSLIKTGGGCCDCGDAEVKAIPPINNKLRTHNTHYFL